MKKLRKTRKLQIKGRKTDGIRKGTEEDIIDEHLECVKEVKRIVIIYNNDSYDSSISIRNNCK